MNWRPNSLILALAVGLAAQGPASLSELKVSAVPDAQRIDQIWMITYVDDSGHEHVVHGKLANGLYVPLIAGDEARLQSMLPVAYSIAKTAGIRVHLIKFTNRIELEQIE